MLVVTAGKGLRIRAGDGGKWEMEMGGRGGLSNVH
jgi:hypothetical protein